MGSNNTYNVQQSTNNGMEAEDYIFMHSPAIAILGMGLSEPSGMTIAQRIHAAGVNTRIILVDDEIKDTVLLTGLSYGVLGYLSSSRIQKSLLACIDKVKSNLVFFEEEGE